MFQKPWKTRNGDNRLISFEEFYVKSNREMGQQLEGEGVERSCLVGCAFVVQKRDNCQFANQNDPVEREKTRMQKEGRATSLWKSGWSPAPGARLTVDCVAKGWWGA